MYVTLFLNAFLLHCVALYCFAYSCTASVANKRHHKVWSNFMLVKNLHQSTITARRFLILCVKMLARRLTGANLFCYIHLYISESLYNTVPISASQKHFWPDCKPEGSLFSAEFVCLSVCLSVCWPNCKPEAPLFSAEFVCLCVSDRHFYPSTLTNFDETWSQGPTLI